MTLRTKYLILGAAGIIVATVASTVWSNRTNPRIRVALVLALQAAYQIYDPSLSANINTGPCHAQNIPQRKGIVDIVRWKSGDNELLIPAEDNSRRPQVGTTVLNDSKIDFYHEHLASPSLRDFRELSHDLLKHADVFTLCNGLRELTSHGPTITDDEHFGPDDFLRFARQGYPLTCRQFSIAFVGLAGLRGYTARVLGLSSNGERFVHAVVEVYSPIHGKWILVDPDFNIAYERRGIYLNAAELHDAWRDLCSQSSSDLSGSRGALSVKDMIGEEDEISQRTGIRMVPLGDSGRQMRQRVQHGSLGLDWYKYVFYRKRNDYLTSRYPIAHPRRIGQYVLQSDANAAPPTVCPEAEIIKDRSVIYWPVGRTSIAADNLANGTIRLTLSTYMPNFSSFEYVAGSGCWLSLEGDYYDILEPDNRHVLRFRATNQGGLVGEETVVTLNANMSIDFK